MATSKEHPMKLAFSALVLVLTLPSLAFSQETKSPLTGKWVWTVAYHGYDEIAKEPKGTKSPLIRNEIAFEGDTVTLVYDRPGYGGNEKTVTGKYTYDDKSKPARITLKELPSEIPTVVIVKVEGEKLTICYNIKGGEVPDDFKIAKDDGREIVEFAKRKN
jgi:uncharacterized protein (TIGR03067 family)